jgi:hypothetical protein
MMGTAAQYPPAEPRRPPYSLDGRRPARPRRPVERQPLAAAAGSGRSDGRVLWDAGQLDRVKARGGGGGEEGRRQRPEYLLHHGEVVLRAGGSLFN